MHDARRFANVALVGFMGTGKSTVGQLAAAMLHFRFVDTDEMIEKLAGKRISDIFATDGEARFRDYEREIVTQLKDHQQTVIATGGGLITNPDNLAALKQHSLVVCLWASPETILKRVGHQTHRPLLNVPDPQEQVRALLEQRRPFYRQADVLLSSDHRGAREVALHLVQHFRSVSKRNERTDSKESA